MKNSSIRIKDLINKYINGYNYIKIIYNSKVIFDDDEIPVDGGLAYRDYMCKLDAFSRREEIVYSFNVEFTNYHHTIITIIGEPI